MDEREPLPTLRSIEVRAGYKLFIALDDGRTGVVDLSKMIGIGRVFKPLQDEKTFARVRISPDRGTIQWPEPKDERGDPLIDIDAEALIQMAAQ